MTVHLGLAAGEVSRDECEHLVERLVQACGGPAAVELAATPVVAATWTVAVTLAAGAEVGAVDVAALAERVGAAVAHDGGAGAGRAEWLELARAAAGRLAAGDAGRVVRFPGQERLVGTVAVDDVTTLSAVDEVRGVAGTPSAGMALVTRDFVRPVQEAGRLVLVVRPWTDDGEVAPFETPVQVACCAVHG